MPRAITIYTGSFKPPHRGHLSLVEIMLKKTKKPLLPGGEPGIIYIFISKKPRDPCSQLDGDLSKEVWLTYLSTLSPEDQARVRIVVSQKSSPILTAMGFVRRVVTKGSKLYLIKSAKNEENRRYDMFKPMSGVKQEELVLPGWENLHSTEMRRRLAKKDKKGFMMYLPPKLSKKQKDELYLRLHSLCPDKMS